MVTMNKAINTGRSLWRLLKSQSIRASSHPLPMTNVISEKYASLTRVLQMHSEATSQRRLFTESAADSSSESSCCRTEAPSGLSDSQNTVSNDMMSKLKTSSRHDLAMVFTCKVCETRQMKSCCRESYEKGVVVVRCDGCDNLHLIADRLGWFGEPGSIEDLLAAREELVKKGPMDSLNLTVEDLAGKKL